MGLTKFQQVELNLPQDTRVQINTIRQLLGLKDGAGVVVTSVEFANFVLKTILYEKKRVIIVYNEGEEDELAPHTKPVNMKLPQETISQIREIENLTNMDMATLTIIYAVSLTNRFVSAIKHGGAKAYSEDKKGKREPITIG